MTVNGVLIVIGSIAGGVFLSMVGRDAHACLPRFQYRLLNLAALLLPPEKRQDAVEAWWADINDLWPSEIIRTLYAFDTIRGALKIRSISRAPARAAAARAREKKTRNAAQLAELEEVFLRAMRKAPLRVQFKFTMDVLRLRVWNLFKPTPQKMLTSVVGVLTAAAYATRMIDSLAGVIRRLLGL